MRISPKLAPIGSIALAVVMLTACSMNSQAKHYHSSGGENFVYNASVGNRFEIVSSEMALKRSHSPAVRKFARHMLEDHAQAENDMRNAVAAARLPSSAVAETLDASHQAMLDNLGEARGRDFDREYMDDQKHAHSEAVTLFRRYAAQGGNGPLQNFAAESLPMLEAHERRAYALNF